MGGTSVSSGAENQAAAAAYVAVRILLERRLNWAIPTDDVPVSVAGEVGGPGDDLQVDFGSRRPPLAVQCKRSLAGTIALKSAIAEMQRRAAKTSDDAELVLLVGPGSSVEVRDQFATDVRNFRQGRTDGLRAITRAVLADVPQSESVLKRLYVVALDVDRDSDAGSQFALEGLRQVLVDPTQAEAAWAVLIRNALKLGQRGKWGQRDVEELLQSNKFKLVRIGPDAAWLEQIDFARKLNARWRQRTAAGLLDHLVGEIDGKAAEPDTLRQLHAVRGACALVLGDRERARLEFARALDPLPLRVEPNTPANVRKAWCDAKSNYGLALLVVGQEAAAAAIAREVIAVDGSHVNAWALLLQATDEDGAVPSDVANAREYRDARARVAVQRGDSRRAIEELSPIVASNDASPPTLSTYGQALINLSLELDDGPERRQVLERAERAATDATRVLENGELDSLLAMVLFIRARARDRLGHQSEAREDYDRAAALDAGEPNILMHVVRVRLENGDRSGAMSLLTNAAAEESPNVRVLRADLRAEAGDPKGAAADLLAALDELPRIASGAVVALYLRIAELALGLDQLDLADRSLTAVSAGGLSDVGPDVGVLRARLAAARGDWAAADMEFRAAAKRATAGDDSLILAELATALGAAGQLDRAVSVFEEAGASDPAHAGFKNYVVALMKAQKFDRVAKLATAIERAAIDAGGSTADVPQRVLDAAIDVATRTEDHATAARLLDARIEQNRRKGTVPLKLALHAAMAHADNGNSGRAADLVNEVLAGEAIDPEDRMRSANVLVKLGAFKRAREVAFTAIRARPNDKRMIGNFINVVLRPSLRPVGAPSDHEAREDEDLAFTEKDGPRVPGDDDNDPDIGGEGRTGQVKADSFVRVVTQDGQRHEYFIYGEQPVDGRLQEYLITDPAVMDLVGKRVGETVVRNPGSWREQRLTIARVLPAMVVVFRRYMRTFSAQFPDEPMFTSFRIGENPTLESLGPILAVMHAGQEAQKRSLAMYDESPVPLGVLANALGKSVLETASTISSDSARRLWVDGLPYTKYPDGLGAALEAKTVVLTRPALMFIDRLGLWQVFANRYQLIAPKSMMDEWQEEIRDLEEMAGAGRTLIRESDGRPVVDSIPAGAAKTALDASRSLHERVSSTARVLPRPASALGKKDDEWRDLLGASSFDAVALSRAEAGVLYADDLVLRFVASNEFSVASFPTIALLDALRAAGAVEGAEFENAIVKLIGWGHDMVPIRPATIAAALGGAGGSAQAVAQVLDRIADSRITPASAAIVAAGGLRLLATTAIVSVSLDDAAEQIAEALTRNRRTDDVIPPFASVVRTAFRLLPNDVRRIEAAVSRVLKSRGRL